MDAASSCAFVEATSAFVGLVLGERIEVLMESVMWLW